MKRNYKSVFTCLLSLCFVAATLIMSGCHDDNDLLDPPTIEDEDGAVVSVFNLISSALGQQTVFDRLEGTHDVTFHISSPETGEIAFPGTVSAERGAGNRYLHCRLRIKDADLPDGNYYISISGENIPDLGVYKVEIKDRLVTEELRASVSYSGLTGAGTEADPYRISTANDVSNMMKGLRNDPDGGMGIFFLQTADIDLSELGHQVAVAPMQGTYDGGNHTVSGLELSHAGGSPDTDLGFFSMLCNATIRNLTITDAVISDVTRGAGILAGSATGRITLENIRVKGKLSGSGSSIGSLIGDFRGAVSVSDVKVLDGTVISGGAANSGGMFGSSQFTGASNIGKAEIWALVNGGDNSAGLIGYARIENTLVFDEFYHYREVRGKTDVGGMFGNIEFSGANSLVAIEGRNNAVCDSIIGNANVGGIAGQVTGGKGKCFEFRTVCLMTCDVTSRGNNAGGLFGIAKDLVGMEKGGLDVPNFNHVRADGDNAGGYIGLARNVDIRGTYVVDPTKLRTILPDTEFESDCGMDVKATNNAGGFIGLMDADSSISGLYAKCSVNAVKSAAGGIVGRAQGKVSNCEFQGWVGCSDLLGGIAGHVDGAFEMELCNVAANIRSTAKWQGGMIGYVDLTHCKNTDFRVSRSYFCGMLSCGWNTGGIISAIRSDDSNNVIIEDCALLGDISAGDYDHPDLSNYGVGGIIGLIDCCNVKVRRCFSAGDVLVFSKFDAVGGLIGTAGEDSWDINKVKVDNCLNMATIECRDNKSVKVGGLVGHLRQSGYPAACESKIFNCANWGEVWPDQSADTGGILGYAAIHTEVGYCFNRGKVHYGNAIIGTHGATTTVYYEDNYFLAGTGKDWPKAIEVSADKLTDKSFYKGLTFDSDHFVMTNYGPLPSGIDTTVRKTSWNPWPSDLKLL